MLATSQYDPKTEATLLSLLALEFGLKSQAKGLIAETLTSAKGSFVRFVWADWPPRLSKELELGVKGFHQSHRGLHPIQMGSAEWDAVFRGSRPDPEGAEAIARIFEKYFPGRLDWVESQRDLRGRISGWLSVRDMAQIGLDLSWKHSYGSGAGGSPEDMQTLRRCLHEVDAWAGRRIKPILDALKDRLQRLYGDRFKGLYVFGSYARPDAGIELPIDSDLDVALILSDFANAYDEIQRISDITYDLGLAHGLVISVIPIREVDYQTGRTNFIRVISEDAVRVG